MCITGKFGSFFDNLSVSPMFL